MQMQSPAHKRLVKFNFHDNFSLTEKCRDFPLKEMQNFYQINVKNANMVIEKSNTYEV